MPSSDAHALTPQQRLAAYLVMKRQVATLEKQMGVLKIAIKTDLENGAILTDGKEEAVLRQSYTTSYDPARFVETFGEARLIECVSVDSKKVSKLIESGDIDAAALQIGVTKSRTAALYIQPVSRIPETAGLNPGIRSF